MVCQYYRLNTIFNYKIIFCSATLFPDQLLHYFVTNNMNAIRILSVIPINPANRLNVRGILVCGLTSISTFFSVRIYTCNNPALFNGLSISISRHWCVMSGRLLPGSRSFLFRIPAWSSQFSNSKLLPTCGTVLFILIEIIIYSLINGSIKKQNITPQICTKQKTILCLTLQYLIIK